MLYEDVRGAKEMLSRTTNADIHLPALEVDAHLTREEFETLVRPVPGPHGRSACSGRSPPPGCSRTSWSASSWSAARRRIPLAAHLIHTALGVAPTTLEQPETVVVEGALCIGAARPSGPPVSGPARQVSGPPGQPGPGPGRPPQQPVRRRAHPARPARRPGRWARNR